MAWLYERLKGAFNSKVEGAIGAGGVLVALFLWRLFRRHIRDDLTVPTWLVAGFLGLVLSVLIVQALRLKTRQQHVEGMAGVAIEATESRSTLVGYSDHLSEILYSFRKVLAGVIPGVDVRDFIEDGILQPARDLLRTRQDDDVRLSILAPDGEEFVMLFAAGHNLESKKNFRLPIESSFSKWALRNRLIYWSSDLGDDDRFTRHPRAAQERDYASIISVPIRTGESDVVAVFNTIFTPANAFDEADFIYIGLIGAVIELVWQLGGL